MPAAYLDQIRAKLTSTGVATYPAGATFGPRQPHDYEFVWINDGDCEYRWGETTVRAPAGAIVLCRPGATDFFRWDPHRRTRHAYFHFSLLARPRAWPPESLWPLVRVPPEGDILRPMFAQVLTWRDRGDPLLRAMRLAQMLATYVLGEFAGEEVAPQDALPDPVERAMRFIHASLEEDATRAVPLAALAGAAACTPEHLCRVFARATGRSPAETVRLARLDRAATLLARSNYTVGQIAALCGFASPFHFSRRFREAFGRSPRRLRAELAAGAVPPVPRLLRLARKYDMRAT